MERIRHYSLAVLFVCVLGGQPVQAQTETAYGPIKGDFSDESVYLKSLTYYCCDQTNGCDNTPDPPGANDHNAEDICKGGNG
jgi:hypothetical protein